MTEMPNQQVRKQHLDLVRWHLRAMTTATKAELSHLTSLSVVTLGALIRQLEATGEAQCCSSTRSESGRPARVYRYNADFKHALALCMLLKENRFWLHSSITDLQGKVSLVKTIPISGDPANTLCEAVRQMRLTDERISSVCVGIPGQMLNGKVLFCDMDELTGLSLEKMLCDAAGCPVAVENDMNTTVCGYAHRFSPHEDECTVGVYFPIAQGPGCGVLVGNRLLRGRAGMAGELVNLPYAVNWRKPPADFENVISDCLQTVAAVLAPMRLVIYREGLDMEQLTTTIERRWPDALLRPEMELFPSILDDYQSGTRALALAPLLPKIKNEGNEKSCFCLL